MLHEMQNFGYSGNAKQRAETQGRTLADMIVAFNHDMQAEIMETCHSMHGRSWLCKSRALFHACLKVESPSISQQQHRSQIV